MFLAVLAQLPAQTSGPLADGTAALANYAENRPLSVTHLGKKTCYVYGADGKWLKKVENLTPAQELRHDPGDCARNGSFLAPPPCPVPDQRLRPDKNP